MRLSAILKRLRAARACVLLVAAVVVGGAWLPALARIAVGEDEHVCHCHTRGGHGLCACPICFPELREEEPSSHPVVSGTCGDAQKVLRPYLVRFGATPALAGVLGSPPSRRLPALRGRERPPPSWRAPPETPPPEGGRAA